MKEGKGGWKGGDVEKRNQEKELCRKGNFALQVINSVHLPKED
jgi:hypothetical protein